MRHVPSTVIVGAQWGDEGKGKIVDLLAAESDLVCRYQGGPNAGHTIVADGETFKIRQIPSGIIQGKASVIGAGCVVDPQVLIDEIDDLEARGRIDRRARLRLRQRAPDHALARRARRRARAPSRQAADRHHAPWHRPGVRGQGDAHRHPRAGPARPEDPAGEARARGRGEERVARARLRARAVRRRGGLAAYLRHAERIGPWVADTSLLVDRALRDGERVLFEGGQGTLLDLDHGTYPFVTSSSPIAAGAAVSFGIGPQAHRRRCSAWPRRT